MGEMSDAPGPATMTPDEPEVNKDEVKVYETDVEGVTSDSVVQSRGAEFPCFDVSGDEFHQNMKSGRRRLRFKNGSSAQKYMSGTRYNRSFYIRTTDGNGDTLQRKIK